MYVIGVIALTIVLPILSIAIESFLTPGAGLTALIGKWFVFWAIGVRLLMAGVTQAVRPSITASGILGISDPAAEKVVAELGYANIAMGLIGVLSLVWPAWVLPAALAGGLFHGLAGVKHAINTERNLKENVAMLTDLFIAAMAAVYLVGWLRG